MRKAIFAAVVAVHIALVWYFLTLRHVVVLEDANEPSMTMVSLPPTELDAPRRSDEQAPSLSGELGKRSEAAQSQPRGRLSPGQALVRRVPQPQASSPASPSQPSPDQRLSSQVPSSQLPPSEPPSTQAPWSITAPNLAPDGSNPPTPDWRTDAEIIAQADAQHIVESEDQAARQAGALTAMIKPFQGPRRPGPAFGWDPNPLYRWQPAGGGGFVMPISDHCAVLVLIMVWVGCSVGELPPPRGDLFLNMHPPVKYGDWDWRKDDP